MSFAPVSGTCCSMSRSMMPLPIWIAPGMWPFAHSLSSRMSTRRNFSPASMRRFTSATFVSLTFFFDSLTSFKNCGACAMRLLLCQSPQVRIPRRRSRHALAKISNRARQGQHRARKRLRNLRLRSFGFGFVGFRDAFLCKRAHQVHVFPAHLFRVAVAVSGHFPFSIGNNPKQFAVGHLIERTGIAPVPQFKFHVCSEIALAVAGLPMAHGAIVAKKFAHFRETLGGWRNGILLRHIVWRHLGFHGPGFFLGEIRSWEKNYGEQYRTRSEERPIHGNLPAGRAPPKERTRLDFERILRPRHAEEKH